MASIDKFIKSLKVPVKNQTNPYLRDGIPNVNLMENAKFINSFMPITGDIQSGIEAGQDLKKGNYGSAALNAVGLLPFVPALGGVLAPSKYVGKTLKGMPTNIDMGGGRIEQFGTDQRIVDTANQYMADKGLLYVPQTQYAAVDPVRAKKIAEAFDKMKDQPNNPKVKKAYDALIEETLGQYEAARKAGAKFEFMPEGQDLYGNPRNAINDIVTNQHMYVFPTESGFGSLTKSQQANPLLQKTGEKWNGKDVTANDIFRAVHDYFGHAKRGVGFRATGEENAWQSHAKMYSPEARPAATSETRGQNSWVNFGKYGKQNQLASPSNTIYADQKTGLMPDWTMIEGLLD